ncbi:hypothetical protein FRC08_009030 [Ceratobasidium sp. 394]|nr:hypothetical protein FRC08_009030 [Ceratobasidium sp. 394]
MSSRRTKKTSIEVVLPSSKTSRPKPNEKTPTGLSASRAGRDPALDDPDPAVRDRAIRAAIGRSGAKSDKPTTSLRTTRSSGKSASPIKNNPAPRPPKKRRQSDPAEPVDDVGRADKRPRVAKATTSATRADAAPASPAASATMDVDSDDVAFEGSQGGDDREPFTAQDMEEVISAWETSVRDVRSRILAASVHDEKLGRDLDAAYIGSAYIQFIGPGIVHGVVDLEHNPNKRGNPRGLNPGHVEILHDIFRRPQAKKDHEAPIYLAVDGKHLSAQQRALMRAADARNLLSKLPPLVLERAHPEEEAQLEEELWVQRVEGRWLSMPELNDRQGRLQAFRSDPNRGMSHILNGNHRTRAMLAMNDMIIAQRDAIRAKLEKNPSNRADIERDMEALQERVEAHTWRCLVYDSTLLTKAAHNYLVFNEHERPSMGMGPGEKAWWLAQKFETEMEELMNAGGTQRCSRAHAANIVQGRWRREIGSRMTMTGRDAESDEPKHVEKVKQLGDLAGADAASRLFFNPLGMELVLDCRPALWAFGELIDKPLAIQMLRPSGGPLIAHVWLSLRTLITLSNVLSGEGITDAETWLDQHDPITPHGYPDAAAHFRALHGRPERVPQLLSKYGVDQSVRFGKMYMNAIKPLEVGGRIDYTSNKVLCAIRGVFDKFASTLVGSKSKPELPDRLLSASIRLYARMVTYKSGHEGEAFYPLATLPSKEVRDAMVARWHGGWNVPGNGDCLAPLEELLAKCQTIWTIGAQGSKRSCNWENWYDRSRGLHQVVLRILEAKTLGSTEARLSEALTILEDPRLPLALKSADATLKEEGGLQTMVLEFCAHKSAKFNYPGVKRLLDHSELDHGSYEYVSECLLKARSAIRASAWEEADDLAGKVKKARRATPHTLDEILSDNTVLGLVYEEFWELAYPKWFVGWEDTEAKRMGTVGAGVGWGLLHRWLVDICMPRMFEDKPARWLLQVASRVLELTGDRAWWSDLFDSSDLPRVPSKLPPDLHVFAKVPGRQRKSAKAKDTVDEADADEDEDEPAAEAPQTKAGKKKKKGKGKKPATTTRKSRNQATSKEFIEESDEGEKDELSGDNKSDPESEDGEMSKTKQKVQQERQRPAESVAEGKPGVKVGGVVDLAKDAAAEPRDDARDVTGRDLLEEADELAEVEPGVDDFRQRFVDRAQLKAHGVGFKPPPAGYQYYHESFTNRPASHVFAPRIASTVFPHNAWQQLAETRDVMIAANVDACTLENMDERLLDALDIPADVMENMLDDLMSERNHLRQGLVFYILMLECYIPRSDLACLLLSDMESGLKDIYMARCVKVLQGYTGISVEEAITEVSRMATDDGLLEENLYRITPDNMVELNMIKTFPQSMRSRVKDATLSFSLANESHQDRDETMRIMKHILPARGLGRNHQESRERALQSIEHSMVRRERERKAPRAVHGHCVDANEPVPPPEQIPVKQRLWEDPLLFDRAKSWRSVGPSLVRVLGDSPFTTGQFTRVPSADGPWLKSAESKAARIAERKRRLEYSEVWDRVCDKELEDFSEQMVSLRNRRNGDATVNPVSGVWSPVSVKSSTSQLARFQFGSSATAKSATIGVEDTPGSPGVLWSSSPISHGKKGADSTLDRNRSQQFAIPAVPTSSPSLGGPTQLPREPIILVPGSSQVQEQEPIRSETAFTFPANQQAPHPDNTVMSRRSSGSTMSAYAPDADRPASEPGQDKEPTTGAARAYQNLFTQGRALSGAVESDAGEDAPRIEEE